MDRLIIITSSQEYGTYLAGKFNQLGDDIVIVTTMEQANDFPVRDGVVLLDYNVNLNEESLKILDYFKSKGSMCFDPNQLTRFLTVVRNTFKQVAEVRLQLNNMRSLKQGSREIIEYLHKMQLTSSDGFYFDIVVLNDGFHIIPKSQKMKVINNLIFPKITTTIE